MRLEMSVSLTGLRGMEMIVQAGIVDTTKVTRKDRQPFEKGRWERRLSKGGGTWVENVL